MSHRAANRLRPLGGQDWPDRWMAEITYNSGREPGIVKFQELEDLDEIVERGPDWNEIEQIVITLNYSRPTKEGKAILAKLKRPSDE